MSKHAQIVLPLFPRSTFIPPVDTVDYEVEEQCS